jgi:hypothetical protein
MWSLVSGAIALAALALLPAPAQAEEPVERVAERLHSDLPLYTFAWKAIWPHGFSSDDGFGCVTRVAWGDWRFTPAAGGDRERSWERYTNYGVFHCAAVLRAAGEQAELDDAQRKYGFFVRLGEARLGPDAWELWALQKGMVPGSEYVLLAREAGGEGLIRRFRVLQRRCPAGGIREVGGLDVWTTRYCRIGSRSELLALARRMLRLPPLGTIAWAAEAPETD